MLGKKIKRLRKQKKLSQRELAYILGVTPSFLCKVETGKRKPNIYLLAQIERELEIEPGSLDEAYHARRQRAVELYERRTRTLKSL